MKFVETYCSAWPQQVLVWAGYFLSSNLKDTVWKQTFLLIRKLAYDDHKLYYCEKRDEKEISNNDVPGQDTFMIEQTW